MRSRTDHPAAGGEMDKAYDPHRYEDALYRWWEERGYFQPETQDAIGQSDPEATPFVITMPPPNVTGQLHTGHALTAAVEDLMTRYHRLRGRPALWLPGTDHAGIATQSVVEKALAKQGTTRHDLGREAFVEQVWDWRAEFGGRITEQHRRLGVGVDWQRERFTLDDGLSRAVQECFLRLYDKGLIYRGNYLVNWDCQLHSVISDIEVEYETVQGHLYHFRYPLEGGGHIPVATTRPETILGDTAVAVHPEDERYADLIGRTALVPMIDRAIPVIADEYVDREFGSGALKITPGHDPNDYEIGKRHGLEEINILHLDGTLNENAGPYAGLDRPEARTKLWEDMRAAGLVIGEQPHEHQVGHSQRSHTIVEPMLSTQWFVKMAPLAEQAMAAVRDKRTQFVPPRFEREFFHWLENIRDWVISRQLWWGHRIPVWYGPDETAFAAHDATEAAAKARAHYGEDVPLRQDEDVLDTWFSSALWPFSTLGWPDETEDMRRFYPNTILETGYDILFFWVARMIMMGLELTGEVPFRWVYLHGLVRDADGRKMSKSLGNAKDPLELIDDYGTDALRFTMVTGSTPGVDMKLTDERLTGSRNFANKLWNMGRFVVSQLGEDFEPASEIDAYADGLALADRWILSRLSQVTTKATDLLERWQLGEAGRQLYDFAWSELADWYLEAAKERLYGDDPAAAETTRQVLYHVLESTLRLLHPFMPFVTEAIWGHLPVRDGDFPALIVSRWPEAGAADEQAVADFDLLRDLVRGIRNARAEYDVAPGRKIAATVRGGERTAMLAAQSATLASLARLDPEALAIAEAPDAPEDAHATVVAEGGVEAWLPLAGMVDLALERERLEGELEAARGEVQRLIKVLANEQFVSRAPEPVVQRERDRLAEAEARVAALEERVAGMG
jgi:valyl-tRNA synthetase